MRWIFIIWAAPLVLFWSWYGLSLYDINFGYVLLTRDVHDLVFQLYGHFLGMEPGSIPALLAQACAVDTVILLAIWGFRRRREIGAWTNSLRGRYRGETSSPNA